LQAVFCLCIIYAVIVSIYFNVVFWSNDSQCAEGHLPHVHWLWRPRNQIIDVLAFNLSLIHVAMFVNGSGRNEQHYRGPSIDASYQVSIHLAEGFSTGNSCFWLAYFLKSSPLKLLIQMNWNLVGSIYGRSSIKIAHFVPIH
jgi:hypothetical protein